MFRDIASTGEQGTVDLAKVPRNAIAAAAGRPACDGQPYRWADGVANKTVKKTALCAP